VLKTIAQHATSRAVSSSPPTLRLFKEGTGDMLFASSKDEDKRRSMTPELRPSDAQRLGIGR
jgi:hypothetical protein